MQQIFQKGKQTKDKFLNDIKMKKEFIRVRSIKDITIFSSLIITGSILIALPTGTGINITGFFMIFAGLILAVILRTGYRDAHTKETYSKKEIYFQQSMQQALLEVIRSKPDEVDLKEADKGNGLKLDIYYSRKLDQAYIQLFEYIPYTYHACSDIYEHEIKRVDNLIR